MKVFTSDTLDTHVMGIHASINGLVIIVVKIHPSKKEWHIKDEFITYDLKLESHKNIVEEFIKKYDVRHFFGNSASEPLYIKRYLTDWESMKLEPSKIIWTFESEAKKIKFEETLQENWNQEIDWEDFKSKGNNDKMYLRLYALAYVLLGVEPYNHSWMLNSENQK